MRCARANGDEYEAIAHVANRAPSHSKHAIAANALSTAPGEEEELGSDWYADQAEAQLHWLLGWFPNVSSEEEFIQLNYIKKHGIYQVTSVFQDTME